MSEQTRPFAAITQELNKGKTHVELSQELQALVQAVQATGKKGTLTLTVTVIPSKMDGGVELLDTVKTVLPKFDRSATLFYADDDGNLTRHDPRQLELPVNDLDQLRQNREAK